MRGGRVRVLTFTIAGHFQAVLLKNGIELCLGMFSLLLEYGILVGVESEIVNSMNLVMDGATRLGVVAICHYSFLVVGVSVSPDPRWPPAFGATGEGYLSQAW